MKLKNKILIITLIFVAIILLTNNIFAAENNYYLKDEYIPPELPDSVKKFAEDKYFTYITNGYRTYYLFLEKTNTAIISLKDNPNTAFLAVPDPSNFKVWQLVYEPGSYGYITSTLDSNKNILPEEVEINNIMENYKFTFYDKTYYPYGFGSSCSIIDSNFDIYSYICKEDSSGKRYMDDECYSSKNLVFQAPPQGLTQVLEEGYQTAQKITTQSITQQLGVLVPVGVVIMATLILVSLIAYFRFWRQ